MSGKTPELIFYRLRPAGGWRFWLAGIPILVGFILSILSWVEVCVEHCTANEDYQLFGAPFAVTGLLFFTALFFLHAFSFRYPVLKKGVAWLLASAFGAELMFTWIQKYEIGRWCPICLTIASIIAIAGGILALGYFRNLNTKIENGNKEEIMKKILQGVTTISFIFFGLAIAFFGVSNPNSVEAVAEDIKAKLAFGKKDSPIEVYFFTDWYCPACLKVDPIIEKLYPKIRPKATFLFVDFPIHKKSINFIPYNLSFMMNNKSQYFRARKLLNDLAEKTDSPKEAEVMELAKKDGISYKEITFIDIRSGMDFFEQVAKKFGIKSTPALVIVNKKSQKTTKLEGAEQIKADKIKKAIKSLSD